MSSNKEQFLHLLHENKAIIYKICRSYCDNKTARDDLAQEIVYNLWKAFPSFDSNFKFSTWMYRIALNVAISYYRKEGKYTDHLPIHEELLIFTADEETEVQEDVKILERFISALGEIDKSIMLLYLDEKSYKEIAAITGITETNVATKIARIKIKLKSNFLSIQNY